MKPDVWAEGATPQTWEMSETDKQLRDGILKILNAQMTGGAPGSKSPDATSSKEALATALTSGLHNLLKELKERERLAEKARAARQAELEKHKRTHEDLILSEADRQRAALEAYRQGLSEAERARFDEDMNAARQMVDRFELRKRGLVSDDDLTKQELQAADRVVLENMRLALVKPEVTTPPSTKHRSGGGGLRQASP